MYKLSSHCEWQQVKSAGLYPWWQAGQRPSKNSKKNKGILLSLKDLLETAILGQTSAIVKWKQFKIWHQAFGKQSISIIGLILCLFGVPLHSLQNLLLEETWLPGLTWLQQDSAAAEPVAGQRTVAAETETGSMIVMDVCPLSRTTWWKLNLIVMYFI